MSPNRYWIAALAGLIAVSPLVTHASGSGSGRYTMHKADDGFVRLDTQTGRVSLCQKDDGGWACKTMDDAVQPIEQELARLKAENEKLRAEVKRLDEIAGLDGQRKDRQLRLPSEKEIDGALNYLDRMIRKFRERFKQFERQGEGEPKQL